MNKTIAAPSSWVVRFAGEPAPGCRVLDLACGAGRHTRFFLDRGTRVTAVDINLSRLGDLAAHPRLEAIAADLEGPEAWPLDERRFDVVVVVNYLWRPLLPAIIAAVAPGGRLIYETFARGNEKFGRPSNPDFLLEPGELFEAVRGELCVMAYEHGETNRPKPAVKQRICAIRER
jgi:SAM-dependent methyltransferase